MPVQIVFIFYFTMTQLAYSLLQRYLSVSAFFNMKFMATDPDFVYVLISFLELLLDNKQFSRQYAVFKVR